MVGLSALYPQAPWSTKSGAVLLEVTAANAGAMQGAVLAISVVLTGLLFVGARVANTMCGFGCLQRTCQMSPEQGLEQVLALVLLQMLRSLATLHRVVSWCKQAQFLSTLPRVCL
jgi:hypothetical protein